MCKHHIRGFQAASAVLLSTLLWIPLDADQQSRGMRVVNMEITVRDRVPPLRIAAREGESVVMERPDLVKFEFKPSFSKGKDTLLGDTLFVASSWQLTGVPLGFEPAQVLTCRLLAKGLGKDENAVLAEVLSKVAVLPRVTAVGATTALPLAGHGFSFVVAIKGMPAPRPDEQPTSVDVVSTNYLRTIRATLDVGRDFEQTDTASSRQVAIVNQAFARQYSPASDIVGRQLSLGGRPDDANIAVVGIVRDILDGKPGERVGPTVYRPFTQAAPQIGWHTAMLVARTDGDPMTLAQPIKDALAQIVPAGAINDCDTLEHRVRAMTASPREGAILFGWLPVVAIVLTGGFTSSAFA
jgi:hypothetical protein